MDLLLTPEGDLELVANDVAVDTGLWSAVLVSLFSDRRVAAAESPDGTLRGWWAERATDPFGSRLWTIAREKQLPATRVRIESLAHEALQWLVDDGVAERLEVEAEFTEAARVEIRVTIVRGSATRWSHLWRGARQARAYFEPFSLSMVLEDTTR